MKHTPTILILFLLLGYFSVGCLSVVYQWVGTASNSFSNPNNWSPVGVPSSNDSITGTPFRPVFYTINLEQESITVENLTISTPDLSFNNGSLTITNTASLGSLGINSVNLYTNNAVVSYLFQGRVNKSSWYMTGHTSFSGITSIQFQGPTNIYNHGTVLITNQFTFTATNNGTTFFNLGNFIHNIDGFNYLGVSLVNTGTFQVMKGRLYIGVFRTSLLFTSILDGALYVAPNSFLSFVPHYNTVFRPTLNSSLEGQVTFFGNDYKDGYSIANIYGTVNFASAIFDDNVVVNIYGNVNIQDLSWTGGQVTNPTGSFTVESVQTWSNGYYFPVLLGNMTITSNVASASYILWIGENAILSMDGYWKFEQLTINNVDDSQWAIENIGTQVQSSPFKVSFNYNNNGIFETDPAICSNMDSAFVFLANVLQSGSMQIERCSGIFDVAFSGNTQILNGASFSGEGIILNNGVMVASSAYYTAPFKAQTGELINDNVLVVSSTTFEKDYPLINNEQATLKITASNFLASLVNFGYVEFPSPTPSHVKFYSDNVFGKGGKITLKVFGSGTPQKFNVTGNDFLDFSQAKSAWFTGVLEVDFTIEKSNIDLLKFDSVVFPLSQWPVDNKFIGRFDEIETVGLDKSIEIKTYYQTPPFTKQRTLYMHLSFAKQDQK